VPVKYNRAPLVQGMEGKKVSLGGFGNYCEGFDASQDLESVLMRQLKDDEIFIEVFPFTDKAFPLETTEKVSEYQELIEGYDWKKWQNPENTEYLLTGFVLYDTSDFSGYESRLAVNSAG